MNVKTIDDVKQIIINQLELMGFKKANDDVLDNPKLKNIYTFIEDNIEIFVVLDKDNDKNCIEFHIFKDNNNGGLIGIRAYDFYTDLLLEEKNQKGYIKNYVYMTIGQFKNSINKE